jgi:hypothetical protein
MSPPLPGGLPRPRRFARLKNRWWLVVGVAGIAVAAGAAVAWFVLSPKSCDVCKGCVPPNSGPTPLGPAFALGTPRAEGGPSNHSYAIVIVPSSGVVWNGLRFNLTSPAGAPLAPGGQWRVLAYNATSYPTAPLASYSFLTGLWQGDGSAEIRSGEILSLSLGPTNLTGQSDRFIAYYPTGCPGAMGLVSIALP